MFFDMISLKRLRLLEVLQNTETGSYRVVFRVTGAPDVYMAVKAFDPEQGEVFTVKVFYGSYSAVRQHWRSQVQVPKSRWGQWDQWARGAVRTLALITD